MIRRGYLLVTPAKNEEKFLPEVIKAVTGQTITPNLWVIVDDGSTDKTPEIIEKAQKKYKWIKSIRLPEHPRDITFHYAYVCREGFEYAINYAKHNHVPFEFIALLDADTIPERAYFEKIIEEFKKDDKLGIASGAIYVNKNGKWVPEINLLGYPRGTGRVWTKRCFFDTGGYRVLPSPDSISNRLAIKKGWKVKQFDSIKAFQLRETSSAEGKIKGYIKNGESAWYLGKTVTDVILGSILIWLINKNPLYSISYIYGFISSFNKINKAPSKIRELYA